MVYQAKYHFVAKDITMVITGKKKRHMKQLKKSVSKSFRGR